MRIEYKLNLNDIKEASRDITKTSNAKILLFYAGFLGLLYLLPLFLKRNPSTQEIIVAVTAIFFSVAIVYLFGRLAQYLSIKRAWNSMRSAITEMTIETSDEGLKITTPVSESKVKWIAYTHWGESSNLLFIYASVNSSILFPKRAFVDHEQIDGFRELLNSKLPKK
jgi:YcxB-like protein